ncbi:MAG: hypothetical protein NC340_09705 [Ruminococcus flavefaciens]|nr:hypothetical protein [Ruminococcus flavefaciens]MCM1230584.1 hypothetical protein [Ruminococcus flavefaciens]
MNKIKCLSVFLCAVVSTAVFTGCECKHKNWNDPDCTTPKTCVECGVTEGEPLGHSWTEADCANPKTCSVCGETEGKPLEHVWLEATCTEPETCELCGEIKGEPLAHIWLEATCTEPKTCELCGETEGKTLEHKWIKADCGNPKTCELCGETEGEPTGKHKWEEADCANPKTCSVCGATEGKANGHKWVDATYDSPKTCSVCGETSGKPLERPEFEVYLDTAVPFEVSDYYSSGKQRLSASITQADVSYEKDKYDGTYNIILKFGGTKTYDCDGDNYSRSISIGIKVYDSEGYVFADSTYYSPDIAVGDSFRNDEKKIYEDLEPGCYYVKLLSTK